MEECAEPRCAGVQTDLAARMASIAAVVESLEETLGSAGAGQASQAPPAAPPRVPAVPSAVLFHKLLAQEQQWATQSGSQHNAIVAAGPGCE